MTAAARAARQWRAAVSALCCQESVIGRMCSSGLIQGCHTRQDLRSSTVTPRLHPTPSEQHPPGPQQREQPAWRLPAGMPRGNREGCSSSSSSSLSNTPGETCSSKANVQKDI
jgi:hypothetical protein